MLCRSQLELWTRLRLFVSCDTMLDALLLLVHPACVVCADDKTMYVMAGLQAAAFFSNLALQPVHPELHEPMHEPEDSFLGEADRGWVVDTHEDKQR